MAINLSPRIAPGAHRVLAAVSRSYPQPPGRFPRVTHPSATFTPPEGKDHVRLACVKHAASVRSEPGSNSQVNLGTTRPALGRPSHPAFVTPSQTRNRSRPSPNPGRPDRSSLPGSEIRQKPKELRIRKRSTKPLPQDPNRRPRIPSLTNHNVKERSDKVGRAQRFRAAAHVEERAYTPAPRTVSNGFSAESRQTPAPPEDHGSRAEGECHMGAAA